MLLVRDVEVIEERAHLLDRGGLERVAEAVRDVEAHWRGAA
jgi:hypothetical protein